MEELITQNITLFQSLAQLTAIPFIIGLLAGLKKAGLIKSGYTPLFALLIGSVIGLAIFLGISEFSVLNVVIGIMLGGTSGLAAIGTHQIGDTQTTPSNFIPDIE